MRILAKQLREGDVMADGHGIRVVTRPNPDTVSGRFEDGREFSIPSEYVLWIEPRSDTSTPVMPSPDESLLH